MKKLLAIILTLSLTVGMLASCSSTETAPEADTTAPDAATPVEDSTEEDATSGTGTFLDEIEEGAEILYWEMQWGNSEYGDTTQAFVDRFNSENEYGITVNLEMIPWDGYYQTFLTAVTSGSAPAACTGATPTPIQYAVMGESLNLDPIMEAWEAEGSDILTNVAPEMFELFTYEGVQYGLPYGVDPKQILYRSDYFEEAGITELPTTYDEFLDVARTLKETFPDKVPVLMAGGGSDAISCHIAFVLNSTNTTGFVDENLETAMTSQAQIENYEFLKTMYDEGLVSEGSVGYASADTQKMWLAGEACIVFGQSGNYIEGTDIEDVSRVLPNISGPSANGDGKYTQCVNAVNGFDQSDYPNAARYFLKWWMENHKELLIGTGNGNLPTNLSFYEDPFYQDSQFKMDTYEYTILQGQTMSAPVSLYPQFAQLEGERIFSVAVQEILSGATVDDALNKAQEDISATMIEYAP